MVMPTHWLMGYFYPRPPRGGRPVRCCRPACSHHHFYPRPPRGGRQTAVSTAVKGLIFLSTPSARRATSPTTTRDSQHWAFLSTPSARRTTKKAINKRSNVKISIHALREEGDAQGHQASGSQIIFLSTPSARRATVRQAVRRSGGSDFYPRPPRGGRRCRRADRWRGHSISIHALREEGDTTTANAER